MRSKKLPFVSRTVLTLAVVFGLGAIGPQSAQAQTFDLLYSFEDLPDGWNPHAGLVRDAEGNPVLPSLVENRRPGRGDGTARPQGEPLRSSHRSANNVPDKENRSRTKTMHFLRINVRFLLFYDVLLEKALDDPFTRKRLS